MSYHLVLLNGPTPGASVELDPNDDPVTMGRLESHELPIDDPGASRVHARVWFAGGAWQIEDCGSRNGTQLNRQAIGQSTLRPGDLIRVGDRLIAFLSQIPSSQEGATAWSIRAGTTEVVEPATAGRPWTRLLSESTATAVARRVALLCRLSASIHDQADVAGLAGLVIESLAEATQADAAEAWLIGGDGRLQLPQGGALGRDLAPDPDSHNGLKLLASMAIDQSQPLVTELSRLPVTHEADGPSWAAAVPIPGQHAPRGALAFGIGPQGSGIDPADVDLTVAMAHQFGTALENLQHRERLEQANRQLKSRLVSQSRLLGNSPAVRELIEKIGLVAPTQSTVLIVGESGTGKELISQSIHEHSERASGSFIAVNCAAFAESILESELFGHEAGAFTGAERRRIGQFERAHRGTLFLDEVGEMSPACQAKLLRVIEGHSFERLGGSEAIQADVRILAATHRELGKLVDDGRFRSDLYYRLKVIELHVPPLRERGDDVLQLAVLFLAQFRRNMGRGPFRLSQAAADALVQHTWPGNVRELRNAIERAVVLGQGDEVIPDDLGLNTIRSGSTQPRELVTLFEAQRRHIEYVIQAVNGNKTQACKILGIGRGTLYKKLAQ